MDSTRNNEEMTTEIALSEEQIEAETEDLSAGLYTYVFKKPFEWDGKIYGQLTFDFDSLTGRDTLAIERELNANRIMVVVRTLSAEFQVRAAARACTEKIGIDALEALPAKDFEKIMNHVRNFFASAD